MVWKDFLKRKLAAWVYWLNETTTLFRLTSIIRWSSLDEVDHVGFFFINVLLFLDNALQYNFQVGTNLIYNCSDIVIWLLIDPSTVDLSLATLSSKRTCQSVVKELVQHPPLHLAIKHCCNYSRVTYDCINGYKLVEGSRVRRCSQGQLLGKEPSCRFPKGKEHWKWNRLSP